MDANNFVGPSGSGYDVYVGGNKVGNFPDVNSAQQAFNSNYHPAAPAPGAGSLQGILDAIASGDTARFNEAMREYNATQAEQQREYNTTATEGARQFDIGTAQKGQENYTSLASDLLKTAASLRGPQDYYQYNQYLSGGRDLMSQLHGDQPVAAFSAPTGPLNPVSPSSLMSSLGFRTSPQLPTTTWDPVKMNWNQEPAPPAGSAYGSASPSTPPPAGAGGGAPPVLDTGGKITGPPGGHILAILQVGERVLPAGKGTPGKTPMRVTHDGIPIFDLGGLVQPPAGGPGIGMEPQKYAGPSFGAGPQQYAGGPSLGGGPQKYTGGPSFGMEPIQGQPQAQPPAPAFPNPPQNLENPADRMGYNPAPPPPAPQVAPAPYQINPAVWDSMSPTAKGLTQSLATASGWNWDDYLAQINAQRPMGTAPGVSVYSYYTPGSARASTEGAAGVY